MRLNKRTVLEAWRDGLELRGVFFHDVNQFVCCVQVYMC